MGGGELSKQSHVNKVGSITVRDIKESDLTDRWCWVWDVVEGQSTCLVGTRSWKQAPVPKDRTNVPEVEF